MKGIAALVASIVGVLAVAAFSGAAIAGNGNGNGGTPPGQASTPPGQAKQAQPAAAPASTSAPAANSVGVKPSNTTKHNTNAPAGSSQTKSYGNGKTAGQIAMKNGASADTNLHGPGNSQPHKVAVCGGHEVDVHALKSHRSATCNASASAAKPAEKAKAEKTKAEEKSKVEVKAKAEETLVAPVASSVAVKAAHLHVTICHATGSSTNPYVRISPSASGVYHGHLGHQGERDIVPPFQYAGQTFSLNWDTNGQAIYNAGCQAPPTTSPAAPAALAAATPAGPAPAPAPAAPIAPAPAAAQPAGVAAAQHTLTKHAVRTAKPATKVARPVATKPAAAKPAATKPAAAKPAGVLAASHTVSKPPKRSGILGSTLPFTGLLLWPILAGAFILLLAGLVARRVGARRI